MDYAKLDRIPSFINITPPWLLQKKNQTCYKLTRNRHSLAENKIHRIIIGLTRDQMAVL